MTHTFTFNTLAFAKKLHAGGIEKDQAETVAEALADVFEEDLQTHLFTQQDGQILKTDIDIKLNELKQDNKTLNADIEIKLSELRQDNKILRAEIAARLSEFKNEILKWVVGLLLSQTAIIASLIKFTH